LSRDASTEKILVVDDEPLISDIIAKALETEGYSCDISHSAEEALERLEQGSYSLIVSDIMMPGKSGIELLTTVKSLYENIAVIMVTAVDDRKTALKALQLGAYGYVIKPFDLNEIILSAVNALERRRLAMQSKQYENQLENEVKRRTAQIFLREEEICLRLTSACEYRDEETGSHIRRLGLYAAVLAEELGWTSQAVDEVRIAAPMHDIGKIGISDNILLKTGKLTDEEFETIKRHTEMGAKILTGSNISLLKMAKDIALNHHEKFDGSGYPNGLKGTEIPESARLVSVLDVYDALVHKRIYRTAVPEDEAIEMMSENVGTHFDPEIYEAFKKVLPALTQIRMQVKDEIEE